MEWESRKILKIKELWKLDVEESKVLDWAVKNPFTEEQLYDCLCEVRISSISRFLGAFLREFYIEEIFENVDDIKCDEINSYIIRNNIKALKIAKLKCLGKEKNLIIFIKQQAAFKKMLIEQFPIFIEGGNIVKIDSINNFTKIFANINILSNYDLKRLLSDLMVSNAQLFLASLLRIKNSAVDKKSYKEIMEGKWGGSNNSLLTFFEQWCIKGHLLHPTPKSKSGFTIEELAKYGPEAKSSFDLELIAVSRDIATYYSYNGTSYEEYMKCIFGQSYEKINNIFNGMKYKCDDYYVIPIHPWQYNYIVNNGIENFHTKELFKINSGISLEVSPLISFRSLYIKNINKYIKLPLDIQITSSKRHLSIRSSHHAVYMSTIISALKVENKLSQQFEFEKEEASISLSKYIAVVYREGINKMVDKKSIVMPAAAFYEKSPINNNESIIDDIIKNYCKLNCIIDEKEGAVRFFTSYVSLICNDVIKLLSVYGIALEAHLQNSIIVLNNFCPTKIIIRDAEAINICLDRLKVNFENNSFFPDSWNVLDGPKDCQKVIMHSLIHSNIGQLIFHISQKYYVKENLLWNIAKEELKKIFKNINLSSGEEDKSYLFEPYAYVKSLLKMKLENRGGNEFLYTKCDNPLHEEIAE